MSADLSSLLAFAQVMRIASEAVAEHARGNLSREQLDQAWIAIIDEAAQARLDWEQSKQSEAATARRSTAAEQQER